MAIIDEHRGLQQSQLGLTTLWTSVNTLSMPLITLYMYYIGYININIFQASTIKHFL